MLPLFTVLILGSSFANKLKKFDQKKIFDIAGYRVKLVYRGFSGQSYHHLLQRPWDIDNALKARPDAIITIIGGNAIRTTVPKKVILENCRDFHNLVSEKVLAINPKGILVASQVPLRFNYNPNNRFHCPLPDQFKISRDFINKKLKTVSSVDQLLIIAGPGRLDNEKLFKDGTHFTDKGLAIQHSLILRKIERILQAIQ